MTDAATGEGARDNETDAQLAGRLATEAGQLLVELRNELVKKRIMEWELKDAGDMASHHFLVDALTDARPADSILSEEGRDDRRRLQAERVWIIDPLDGTNEYGEGRADWAVHVALWERGELTAAAVSLPSIERTFVTDPPTPMMQVGNTPPRLVTSRFRAPYEAAIVAQALGAQGLRLGSAGAKAMAVLLGEADLYVHAGGMYEWDSAAPAAVAMAAGLHASRIDGTALRYNQSDPWLPDFVVCRPELAEQVLEVIRRS